MTESTALAKVTNKSLATLLQDSEDALANALSAQPVRLGEFVTALDTAVRLEPKLAAVVQRNPNSVRNAIMHAALLGLRPGPVHKHFALVPYGDECVGIVEWRGYVDLANRGGQLDSDIVVRVVYEHDVKEKRFTYEPMTGEIRHEFDVLGEHADKETEDKMVAVYATCKVKGRNGYATVLLTRREVEKRRAASASWKSEKGRKASPWATDPAAMWKKSAIRALLDSGKVPMNRAMLEQADKVDNAADQVEEPEVVKPVEATVRDVAPESTEEREEMLDEIELLIRDRAKGDPEKVASIRVDIEDSVGKKLEDVPTDGLRRMLAKMRKAQKA